jgi:hypothetical protein
MEYEEMIIMRADFFEMLSDLGIMYKDEFGSNMVLTNGKKKCIVPYVAARKHVDE